MSANHSRVGLVAAGLTHSYGKEDVLVGVDLVVNAGETVAIVGSSGSGKSTLLLCLGAVIHPLGGNISFEERSYLGMNESELAELRLSRFGFVFQFGLLLPELSAIDNVALPLKLSGMSLHEARERAKSVLSSLNLSNSSASPADMSGGEAQRVAVARALVTEPDVIFADEPTGALDSENAKRMMDLVMSEVEARGMSLVMVTHDESIASWTKRIIKIQDGKMATAGR